MSTLAPGRTLKPHKLAVLLSLALLGLPLCAVADEIEFNTDILDVHDKTNIDLSRFSRAGYIMPGIYVMSLRVNNKDEIPDQNIEWLAPESDPKSSIPCLTPRLVDMLGLKDEVRSDLRWLHDGRCLDPDSLSGIGVRGDLGSSTLYLNIPQSDLVYRAPNWDPPSQWDEGIPGVLFDYYVDAQTRHEQRGGDSQSLNGNGTAGINVGPWRLRADWQASVRRGQGSREKRWDWNRYYAWRALPALGAKLTLGESALYSDIFDSFRFSGISLQSDDRMLPPNLRGYAPEITGVAKTNAKVIISQQGRVIQETQVAAGPFRIQDLNDMVSGTLDVRVEEQNGTVQQFTVNTASVPYLTRPGQIRYKLASGRPSDAQHHTDGPMFATGEFSWGVNNGWSLYGGGVGSAEYDALALGVGRDLLMFGAVSFDMTSSRASLPYESDGRRGNSWRLSYSKRFDSTGSQVTFAGYRFSQQNFMSMGEYLDARRYGEREGSSKELYTITFNQQLADWGADVYLNYSHQTYWDRPTNNRYTLTMSRYFDIGHIRNISLSATAYRSRYYQMDDKGVYLSVSLPWGGTGSLSYNATINQGGNTHQLSYYDRAGDHDYYQISSGLSHGDSMASGYWTHEGDRVTTNLNASYQSGSYSALSLSLQGGATATAKGAALHRSGSQGGTRMLLDTGDVPDIPVKGFGSSVLTNRFGKAVVSDVNSYYRSRMSIDLDALPDNAEASRTVVQDTLTEGAIGYRKFDVVSGARAMATIRLPEGGTPPFGAGVENGQGQNTGVVGDEGNVYLSGIHPGDTMRVTWGVDGRCMITLPDSLPTDLTHGLLLPCTPVSSAALKKDVRNKLQAQVKE
ncbi:outer membrane usher protein [Intestinirhabdus alba]|nr:outer membrane usher protein [Intestinirhabdus alba]